jgi:hypothetical protein
MKKGDHTEQLTAVWNTLIIPAKAKVKFTLEQATRVQRGRRGTALLFL